MSQLILKLIAALTMLIDHAGVILFPQYGVFRIIGRLAFPIYAYCIAEGFFYTKNRLKYFLRVLLLGVLCQIVYDVVENEVYLGILITFSISIILMYLTDSVKCAFSSEKNSYTLLIEKMIGRTVSPLARRIISALSLALGITAAYVLCLYVRVDYGFFGIMLPVLTNLFPDKTRRFFMFSAALIALCINNVQVGAFLQLWSLFTVPIIALYNGKPGKYRMKYFFYVFYPAHLAILYLIDMLI